MDGIKPVPPSDESESDSAPADPTILPMSKFLAYRSIFLTS